MIFTFIHSEFPQPPTRVPSHFTYSQNTNTIPLYLLDHMGTITSLKHCPYIPLPDLHTRFWRQQFRGRLMRHSLLRTLFQPSPPAQLSGSLRHTSFTTKDRILEICFSGGRKTGILGEKPWWRAPHHCANPAPGN